MAMRSTNSFFRPETFKSYFLSIFLSSLTVDFSRLYNGSDLVI